LFLRRLILTTKVKVLVDFLLLWKHSRRNLSYLYLKSRNFDSRIQRNTRNEHIFQDSTLNKGLAWITKQPNKTYNCIMFIHKTKTTNVHDNQLSLVKWHIIYCSTSVLQDKVKTTHTNHIIITNAISQRILKFANCRRGNHKFQVVSIRIHLHTKKKKQILVVKTQGKDVSFFASKNCIDFESLKQIKLPHLTKDALHTTTHIHLHIENCEGWKTFKRTF